MLDRTVMAKMGIAPNAVPAHKIDYGIDIPRWDYEYEKARKAFDALQQFSASEVARMNFVPQMLVAVALDQISKFVNLCHEKRYSDFKKRNRVLRQCVEQYAEGLKKDFGKAFRSYVAYVNRYFNHVALQLAQTWYTIGNVVNKQMPDKSCRDIATHIAMIHYLLDSAEEYEQKNDKIIAERFGDMLTRNKPAELQRIIAVCKEIETEYGYKVTRAKEIDLCLNVLATQAALLADAILGEEANVSKC